MDKDLLLPALRQVQSPSESEGVSMPLQFESKRTMDVRPSSLVKKMKIANG